MQNIISGGVRRTFLLAKLQEHKFKGRIRVNTVSFIKHKILASMKDAHWKGVQQAEETKFWSCRALLILRISGNSDT